MVISTKDFFFEFNLFKSEGLDIFIFNVAI